MTSAFHIVIAMKPCEGTFAENALKHGIAGLAIDACRIEGTQRIFYKKEKMSDHRKKIAKSLYEGGFTRAYNTNPQGRFPANVIHDASAEVLAGFPQTTTNSRGVASIGSMIERDKDDSVCYGKYRGRIYKTGDADSGTAARFFHAVEEYIAKDDQ